MRGVHSIIDDARRNVFTEVARLAYTGDYDSVDSIPYRIIPGEIAGTATTCFWSGRWWPPGSSWPWAWISAPAPPGAPEPAHPGRGHGPEVL